MLVVHSCTRSQPFWLKVQVGSSVWRFAYLCMLSPFECCYPSFECGDLGLLLHEGCPPIRPSDRPCRDASPVDATTRIVRMQILVMERHAAVRTLEAKQYTANRIC